MNEFEYKLTKHSSEDFNRFVYFCSEQGECALDQVPLSQTEKLTELLNKEGSEGWEMAQMLPGMGGIIVVWKRRK